MPFEIDQLTMPSLNTRAENSIAETHELDNPLVFMNPAYNPDWPADPWSAPEAYLKILYKADRLADRLADNLDAAQSNFKNLGQFTLIGPDSLGIFDEWSTEPRAEELGGRNIQGVSMVDYFYSILQQHLVVVSGKEYKTYSAASLVAALNALIEHYAKDIPPAIRIPGYLGEPSTRMERYTEEALSQLQADLIELANQLDGEASQALNALGVPVDIAVSVKLLESYAQMQDADPGFEAAVEKLHREITEMIEELNKSFNDPRVQLVPPSEILSKPVPGNRVTTAGANTAMFTETQSTKMPVDSHFFGPENNPNPAASAGSDAAVQAAPVSAVSVPSPSEKLQPEPHTLERIVVEQPLMTTATNTTVDSGTAQATTLDAKKTTETNASASTTDTTALTAASQTAAPTAASSENMPSEAPSEAPADAAEEIFEEVPLKKVFANIAELLQFAEAAFANAPSMEEAKRQSKDWLDFYKADLGKDLDKACASVDATTTIAALKAALEATSKSLDGYLIGSPLKEPLAAFLKILPSQRECDFYARTQTELATNAATAKALSDAQQEKITQQSTEIASYVTERESLTAQLLEQSAIISSKTALLAWLREAKDTKIKETELRLELAVKTSRTQISLLKDRDLQRDFELAEAKTSISNQFALIQDLKSKILDGDLALSKAEDTREKLSKELLDALSRILEKDAEITTLEYKIATLGEEKETADYKCTELEAEVDDLHETIAREHDYNNKIVQDLQGTIANQKDFIAQYTNEHTAMANDLEATINRLRKELQEAVQERKALASDLGAIIQSQKKYIEDLRQQYEKETTAHQSTQAALRTSQAMLADIGATVQHELQPVATASGAAAEGDLYARLSAATVQLEQEAPQDVSSLKNVIKSFSAQHKATQDQLTQVQQSHKKTEAALYVAEGKLHNHRKFHAADDKPKGASKKH